MNIIDSAADRNYKSSSVNEVPRSLSSRVIVGSGSVLGMKYESGIMLISSTLLCYGSSKMFPNMPRFHVVDTNFYSKKTNTNNSMTDGSSPQALIDEISQINDLEKKTFYPNKYCVLASTGEYSDFQYLVDKVEEKVLEDFHYNNVKNPDEIASLVSNIHYEKRNKFKPLLNNILVAGISLPFDTSIPSITSIDLYGTLYKDDYIATGSSKYFGITLLREKYYPNMSELEAKKLLIDCMKSTYYLETTASRLLEIVTITNEGVTISPRFVLESTWNYPSFTKPTIQGGSYCF